MVKEVNDVKIIIYGAGKNGELALRTLERYGLKSSVIGFADSNKQGEYLKYPIVSIDDINKEMICIIAIEKSSDVVEVQQILVKNEINHIYWFTPGIKKQIDKSFFEDCCRQLEGCILPQVEMHIMDACNLNCRGCAHYSPIFEREIPNFDERIKDVRLLKEKFDDILRFYILGGEPFLNPEVGKYAQTIREILPNTDIRIVTNGLLVPKLSQDILKAIKDANVIIEISKYEPTYRIIDEIKAILNKAEVAYIVRDFDLNHKFNLPLSFKENDGIYCISNGCVTIWNGKIAKCPQVMYMDYFNKHFSTSFPVDGILNLEDCPEREELKMYLKKEVLLCKHCAKNEVDWSVCGKNASLSDFVADC